MSTFGVIVTGAILIAAVATNGFGCLEYIRDRRKRHKRASNYNDYYEKHRNKTDTSTGIGNKPRKK